MSHTVQPLQDETPMQDPTTNNKKEIFIIDGSSFIFRAFHALPLLTRADGTAVNAVYGYVKMLLKIIKDQKPNYFVVVFDTARKSFRNDIYPDYKAHRPPPPEELIPQFGLVREATEAFHLPSLEMEGYEADDIIATLTRKATDQGAFVTIISSDKDLMQLIGPNVRMYDTIKDRFMGREQVIEKFGLGPEGLLDLLSLAGDSADNVPGVPSIGPKTALTLLEEYGSLEELLDRAEEIKQPKRRQVLIDHREDALLSKKLIRLEENVDIDGDLEKYALPLPDAQKVKAFCQEQNFKSLVATLDTVLQSTYGDEVDTEGLQTVEEEKSYSLIQSEEQLKAFIEQIYEKGFVGFDTETTSLDAMTAKLVGISMSVEPGKACYIPLTHKLDLLDQSPGKNTAQLPLDKTLEMLKPVLSDPAILKIGHHLKYDQLVLKKYEVELHPIDDTLLMSFLISSGKLSHSLDNLAIEYFGHQMISFKEIAGTGKSQKTFDEIDIEQAGTYAAEDADYTLRLYQKLKPELTEHSCHKIYEMVERPLIQVLCSMEEKGVKIDPQLLTSIGQEFQQKSEVLAEEIYEVAGERFNIGSPKQLGDILFEKLGYEGGKKGKSGAYATNVKILEELAAKGHLLPEKVLSWRQLTKLNSTYVDGLLNQLNPQTQRVHTSYLMTGALTGRLASTEPNLQNIPVRTEEGRRIREVFIAEKGFQLLSLDYSQIELRLLAHMADIDALKKAFLEGLDIHAMTASEMFNTPIEGMDPMIRRQAKAINFGIIYGISAFGLSQQLGISRSEASDYIQHYFERFPGIRKYMQKMKDIAAEAGYIETILGRRIHLNDIQSKVPMKRAFAERQAINAPLQGSAADIIKRAMIKIDRFLQEGNYKTRMLLQVHDELLFELADDEHDLIPELQKLMQNALDPITKVDVPLLTEAGLGQNWAEAH